MKLVSEGATYEKKYKLEDQPEDKWPVFILKRLSADEVNRIDDQSTSMGKKNAIQYLAGTVRRLKVDTALVDWRNIEEEDGSAAPCTSQNKAKLPASIQSWLEEDINETNKIKTGLEDAELKK